MTITLHLYALRRNEILFVLLGGGYMKQVLLSVEDAAQRLGGISRWTLYAWMSQGRLRKTKVGSRVMIAEHDIEEFIESCNPQVGPSAPQTQGS